jgi:uncharacterized Ntn-hydrolase superfamily protein
MARGRGRLCVSSAMTAGVARPARAARPGCVAPVGAKGSARPARAAPRAWAVRALPALAVLAVVVIAGPGWGRQAAEAELSTFSIVACDPAAGFLGVGIQSRVVAAGAIVPAAEANVGAIATQALANVEFKALGLELLRQGLTAAQVRDRFVEVDPGHDRRQFAIVDAQCRVAAFTGDSTIAWAGHRTGRHYSVQGNILTGQEVVDAMAAAYEAAVAEGRPFGERLLASLEAGQDAGGDRRGRQGAGLLIVREGGGYRGGDDRYADLRVEDHVEPILELGRVYDVWMSLFHPVDHFLPRGRKPIPVATGPHICELRNMLAAAGHGSPAGEGAWCPYDDEVIGALKRFQRAEGLAVRPDLTPEAAARLRARAGSR